MEGDVELLPKHEGLDPPSSKRLRACCCRAEKYKAKQAADSFFVRLGDLVAALVVFSGTNWFALDASGFALVNIGVIAVWLAVAVALVRYNRRLVAAATAS